MKTFTCFSDSNNTVKVEHHGISFKIFLGKDFQSRFLFIIAVCFIGVTNNCLYQVCHFSGIFWNSNAKDCINVSLTLEVQGHKNHLKSSESISVFIVTNSLWWSYGWVSVYARFYAETVCRAEQALCLQMIHGNTNKESWHQYFIPKAERWQA